MQNSRCGFTKNAFRDFLLHTKSRRIGFLRRHGTFLLQAIPYPHQQGNYLHHSSFLTQTSHKKALQKAHEALCELDCEDVLVDGFEPYWGYLALTWTPSTQKFLSNLANVCCTPFEKGLKESNIKGRRHYPPEPHCTIRSFQSKDVPTEIKDCIPKEGKVLMPASSIRKALCIHINGVFKHKSDFYNTKYKSICL